MYYCYFPFLSDTLRPLVRAQPASVIEGTLRVIGEPEEC